MNRTAYVSVILDIAHSNDLIQKIIETLASSCSFKKNCNSAIAMNTKELLSWIFYMFENPRYDTLGNKVASCILSFAETKCLLIFVINHDGYLEITLNNGFFPRLLKYKKTAPLDDYIDWEFYISFLLEALKEHPISSISTFDSFYANNEFL